MDNAHATGNNISLVFFNCIDYNVKLIDGNCQSHKRQSHPRPEREWLL